MVDGFLPLCHAVFTARPSLFATLFFGGLAGSLTHCVGMCGPFVLSQTAVRLDALPLRGMSLATRLQGAALAPYHLGRMTGYAFLGVLATLLLAPLRSQDWFRLVSALFLVIAGVIFILTAFPVLRPHRLIQLALPAWLSLSLKGFFAHPTGWRGYVLGVALGFLPCGLVYAALFSVAARGEPLTALWGMLVFAAGTVPSLVLVGLGGQFVLNRFRGGLRLITPVLMTLNSLALFAMAGEMLK